MARAGARFYQARAAKASRAAPRRGAGLVPICVGPARADRTLRGVSRSPSDLPSARARRRGPAARSRCTVGVDTGGTFTDLAWVANGEVKVEKLASTPPDPGAPVVRGLAALGALAPETHVVHGTTVALNALLEGRTARVALVCNRGFQDLIEIGRQDRPELYALHPVKPAPLVPRELRFEIGQRSWPAPEGGGVVEVERPSDGELRRLARRLRRARPEAIAIGLLHAYADPEIEERVARALQDLGVPITCSARLVCEYREFERFSTAVANAALAPLMGRYLGGLGPALGGARLSLLQSSGGTLPAERAAQEPVRVLLSGPAGGVAGATRAAFEAGFDRLVGLDMGGTSTDVCFSNAGRALGMRGESARIAGHPIAVPSLDIHTIGTGGGSLAALDETGVLRVGPESAGAEPGPVCYGKSDRLTITDAHVQLGHVAAGAFLGGRLELDVDAVARAFEKLAKKLGVSVPAAAQGVLDVARAAMRRAVGVMTMQRGQDPRELPLVAFGGAGGLHAAALAESLGMRAALVPLHPGVQSALGMARAEPVRERSQSALEPWAARAWPERRRALEALARELRGELAVEGGRGARAVCAPTFALRYAGQSFELVVPAGPRADESFHAAHEEAYGYRLDRPIELVHVGVRAALPERLERPAAPRARKLPAGAVARERRAWFGRAEPTPVIERSALSPGHCAKGPLLVEEYSGTTLVPPGARMRVTAGGHLQIEMR